MPKRRLKKSLQDYLSKIKIPNPSNTPPPQNTNPNPNHNSKTKTWFLSACKLPSRTQSFAQNRTVLNATSKENPDRGVTLADIDRFLLENFRSLCVDDDSDDDGNNDNNDDRSDYRDARRLNLKNARVKNKGKERAEPRESKEPDDSLKVPIFLESPRFLNDPPPEISGSSRFFITRASSSSLIEDAARSSNLTVTDDITSTSNSSSANHIDNYTSEPETDQDAKLPDDSIAILTQSRSPYRDFKRSMKEIVEARARTQEKRIDWEFMEELLFCYLRLNEKRSYKYILSAFVDVVMALRQKSRREVATARSRFAGRSQERFLGSSVRTIRRNNNNNNNNNYNRRREIVAWREDLAD